MLPRISCGFVCALAFTAAYAAEYRLDLNAERRGDSVSVAPTLEGPPGKRLRYEIEAHKEGRSSSRSQQGGQVTLGEDGRARLSQMSFSAGDEARCAVSVRVYEARRLVAAESADCRRAAR